MAINGSISTHVSADQRDGARTPHTGCQRASASTAHYNGRVRRSIFPHLSIFTVFHVATMLPLTAIALALAALSPAVAAAGAPAASVDSMVEKVSYKSKLPVAVADAMSSACR